MAALLQPLVPLAEGWVVKLTTESNWRVEITPRSWEPYARDTPASQKWDCECMAQMVREQVSEDVGVAVICDERSICSHCGLPWNPEGHGYNDCCESDRTEWKAAHKDDPALVWRVLGEHVEEPAR